MSAEEKPTPVHEGAFHHDGRGPELQRIIWKGRGSQVIEAIEYFNPEDEYTPANLKWVELIRPEALAMASEEVHGAPHHTPGSRAAVHRIDNSKWMGTFQQRHLNNCSHFQLMFYDEIIDVICESLKFGQGSFNKAG